MRTLSLSEAAILERYIKQTTQLRRVERMAAATRSSNALIDRIIHDVGDSNSDLMADFMTLKSRNYANSSRYAKLLPFVRKLVALTVKRARAIEELDL